MLIRTLIIIQRQHFLFTFNSVLISTMSSLPPCELHVCQFSPTLKRKPFHTCKMIIILIMILMLIWNPGALDTKTRCWIKHFLHRFSDSRGVIIMSSTPRTAPGAICWVFFNNVKCKHSIFPGDSIRSAFRPTSEGGKAIRGRTFIKQTKKPTFLSMKKWGNRDGLEGLIVQQRPRWLSCPWLLPITQTGNHAGVAVQVAAA